MATKSHTLTSNGNTEEITLQFEYVLLDRNLFAAAPIGDDMYYEIRKVNVHGETYYAVYLVSLNSGSDIDVCHALYRGLDDTFIACQRDYDMQFPAHNRKPIDCKKLMKKYGQEKGLSLTCN